jgi:Fe-S-cluster containining protein
MIFKAMASKSATPEPWYRDGLRFSCTRCGNCCTGAPGDVWLSPDELATLADFLQQPPEQVRARYTRGHGDNLSLRERPNGDCVFWDRNAGCTVYAARPTQCRTWPFWASTTATRDDWNRTRSVCPGAGQGEWFPAAEISRRVQLLVI